MLIGSLDNLSEFQSTHPRGVRHTLSKGFNVFGSFQSTHPRGVRPTDLADSWRMFYVSIHAPAWGATEYPFDGVVKLWFQSTHPRGVRQVLHCVNVIVNHVSIHAPAWGATIIVLIELKETKFQSTHPRGVRPKRSSIYFLRVLCFNPRTRVGCDLTSGLIFRPSRSVSIHAPAWGAT